MTFHRPFHRSSAAPNAYSIGYSIAPSNVFHRYFHRGFSIPPHPYGDRRARRGLRGLATRRPQREGREEGGKGPRHRHERNNEKFRCLPGADRGQHAASPWQRLGFDARGILITVIASNNLLPCASRSSHAAPPLLNFLRFLPAARCCDVIGRGFRARSLMNFNTLGSRCAREPGNGETAQFAKWIEIASKNTGVGWGGTALS